MAPDRTQQKPIQNVPISQITDPRSLPTAVERAVELLLSGLRLRNGLVRLYRQQISTRIDGCRAELAKC